MAGLTQALAEFIAGLQFARIPPQAVETVKRGAIDCVGALVLGRDEPVVQRLRDFLSPGDEARFLLDRGRTAARDAALVNAAAAHALDYDDTGLDGHPSVILVPAVLAEGERLDCSGKELITAYVAGYETWAELSGRDTDRHHGKGWHPTAVFGTLAAAAASARLARLDAARTAHALGIAASMAAGLVANFGSMAKPFQVGRAAHNGLLATRLAACGTTAAHDALEHRAGFLRAISPAGRVRTDSVLRKDFHIIERGLNIKRYPVCYALHRAIDAAMQLRSKRAFSPAEVQAVEVSLGRHQAGMARHHAPQSALDAKFSAEFAVAAALLAGEVSLAILRDDFVRSPQVQSLMSKVRIMMTDEADADEPLFSPHDTVRVTCADGRVLASEPVRHAKGHAKNPIDLEALRAKFDDCTRSLAQEQRAALFERLAALEKLQQVAALYSR